jgi:EmrB/QacA subfamily drug resistance transporter
MSTDDSQQAAIPARADASLDPAVIRLGFTLVAGAFASLMDATIISVAINNLGQTFDVPLSTIQWVLTGYLLALAMVIPLTGWVVGRFGQRRAWLIAVTLFLLGSILSACAWSAPSLIAFRIVQGLGGGLIVPLAQTIIVRAVPQRQLTKALGIVAVPSQLAPVIGPVVGGVIVEYISWRWLFLINVPICLGALALSLRYVTDYQPAPGEERGAPRFDLIGLLLLSPGLAALLYGLSESGTDGFGNLTVIIWLVVGTVLVVAYTIYALRSRVAALIDVTLFRARSFTLASILMFLFGISLFGTMFLLPLFYTDAQGRSTVVAGLLLAPQGVGALLAFILVGKLTDRFSSRALVIGFIAISVLGTVPFVFVGSSANTALLGVALFVRGIGLGGSFIPLNAVAFQDLPRSDIPHASSTTNITMRIGASFGTAVLALILQHEIGRQAHAPKAVSTAFGHTFLWTLVFAVVTFIPAFFLPGRPSARKAPAAQPALQPVNSDNVAT